MLLFTRVLIVLAFLGLAGYMVSQEATGYGWAVFAALILVPTSSVKDVKDGIIEKATENEVPKIPKP